MKMPEQRYISNELTHFVGRGLEEEAQYFLLLKILNSGWLTHPPHTPNISGGLSVETHGKISSNNMYNPQSVCFCDIPVSDLAIHMQKYSRFGLSFGKDFIVSKGGAPIFYIPNKIKVKVIKKLTTDEYENLKRTEDVDAYSECGGLIKQDTKLTV